VSAPFTVSVCRVCDHACYPPRILCPNCGASDWGRRLADTGVVEEVTVRRPVFKRRQLPWGNWLDQEETKLGSVKTDLGPRVVVLLPEGAKPGDRVTLAAQASTAIAIPGQVVEAVREQPAPASEPGE
jgi:uncharacterized OB-fold protein